MKKSTIELLISAFNENIKYRWQYNKLVDYFLKSPEIFTLRFDSRATTLYKDLWKINEHRNKSCGCLFTFSLNRRWVANDENFRANIFTPANCNNTFSIDVLKLPLIYTRLNCFAKCLRCDIDLPLNRWVRWKLEWRFVITITQVRFWTEPLQIAIYHMWLLQWKSSKWKLLRYFFALLSIEWKWNNEIFHGVSWSRLNKWNYGL